MSKQRQVGFVTMGATAGGKKIKEIGIGMLGYAFMGKAHSNAYRKIQYMTWPPPLMPRLVAICGRNEPAVAEAARRCSRYRRCAVSVYHKAPPARNGTGARATSVSFALR